MSAVTAAVPLAVGPTGKRPSRRFAPATIMVYGVLIVAALYYLLPLYVMIVTSLKGLEEVRDIYDLGDQLLIIAADHPARGSLAVGDRPMAMASRTDLLDRIMVALARPGVDGVLGTADVLEDMLLLGALADKIAIGSMNRGGLPGSEFEMDDRFTAYTASGIEAARLDGGKMLRIDPADPVTAATLGACGDAVSALAGRGLVAMIEPFMMKRASERRSNDLSAEAVIRSIAIASGLVVLYGLVAAKPLASRRRS